MPRKRKKKTVRIISPSRGALPDRIAGQFLGSLLVFSDASQKRLGGLAAVLFDDPDGEPIVVSHSVPLAGSNELELAAAVFALQQAVLHFPGRPLALFSDNLDAVNRLRLAKRAGLADDPLLTGLFGGLSLDTAEIHWIKAHACCRGNLIADLAAADAAK